VSSLQEHLNHTSPLHIGTKAELTYLNSKSIYHLKLSEQYDCSIVLNTSKNGESAYTPRRNGQTSALMRGSIPWKIRYDCFSPTLKWKKGAPQIASEN
jgi:hypothetical protein